MPAITINKRQRNLLINIVWFKLSWLALVLLGNKAVLAVAPLTLLIYTLVAPLGRRGWTFVAAVTAIGFMVDCILIRQGVMIFTPASAIPPVWLLNLWVVYATLLAIALAPLLRRGLIFALFSALAGALSYLGGAGLGAAETGSSYSYVVASPALFWFVAGLLCHYAHRLILAPAHSGKD